MAANIEIKARLRDPEYQMQIARDITGRDPEILVQKDTFFATSQGRLKLREINQSEAQLIHYFRSDDSEVRKSDYVITPIEDPVSFCTAMERAYGIRGVVNKIRKLWIVDFTRLHFDEVENLGNYFELEAVLGPNQDEQMGHAAANSLLGMLDVQVSDYIDCAYIDLLEKLPKANTR